MPDVKMPDFKMPDVDMASIRRLGRPEPKRRSLLPWVIVAGVSAAFAGWWLATSSVTGPKVRAVAERVRTRIDELRNGGAEWEDGEEQAESFWSSESGWESGNTPSSDGEGASTGAARPRAMATATMTDDDAASATDSWDVSSAASQTSSDPSVGGTGFDGDTTSTSGGESSEREG
jgi:hypothetical protein